MWLRQQPWLHQRHGKPRRKYVSCGCANVEKAHTRVNAMLNMDGDWIRSLSVSVTSNLSWCRDWRCSRSTEGPCLKDAAAAAGRKPHEWGLCATIFASGVALSNGWDRPAQVDEVTFNHVVIAIAVRHWCFPLAGRKNITVLITIVVLSWTVSPMKMPRTMARARVFMQLKCMTVESRLVCTTATCVRR